MPKTPQEKKQLSYQKDTRNVYRENDRGSMKLIKMHKKTVNRQNRRAVTLALEIDKLNGEAEKINLVKTKIWKKQAFASLGEFLKLKNKR